MDIVGLSNYAKLVVLNNYKSQNYGNNLFEIMPFDQFTNTKHLYGYFGLKISEYTAYIIHRKDAIGEHVIAINCGWGNYQADVPFLSDRYYMGASYSYYINIKISETKYPAIYQYGRWGYNFKYNIPINNGDYYVTLMFADPWYDEVGERVFNIALNEYASETVDLTKISLERSLKCSIADSGYRRAIDIPKRISAINGRIAISFTSIYRDAIVAGIRINKAVVNAATTIKPLNLDAATERKEEVIFVNNKINITEDEILDYYNSLQYMPSEKLYNKSLYP